MPPLERNEEEFVDIRLIASLKKSKRRKRTNNFNPKQTINRTFNTISTKKSFK